MAANIALEVCAAGVLEAISCGRLSLTAPRVWSLKPYKHAKNELRNPSTFVLCFYRRLSQSLHQIIIFIPNAIMSHTAHHEVISVLTELYTLLDTLAAIPPDTLRLPPADTGVHPTFNADAASEGGYSLEAVQALSALPYVYGGAIIGPSTSTN
jgi:hypothetical protein